MNLNIKEMATLAVLPRAPSRLIRDKKKLDLTRNQLLKRYLKEEDYKKITKITPTFRFLKYSAHSPHFVNFLLKKCRPHCLKESAIHSSLDLSLQKEIQKVVKDSVDNLKDKSVSAASALVVDNSTGQILSYIGSHDFFDEQGGQIDGVQQRRQPGSTLKPFTYAYAFMRDHYPSSILPDVETNYNVGGGIYIPRNYSNRYLGPVRASFALANSLNVPALHLVDYYGVDQILNAYRSLDFDLPKSANDYGVGITLGNGEVSLYGLVRAYTAFSNEGSILNLTPFKSKKIEKRKTFLSADATHLISEILAEPHRREHSFGRNSNLDFPFKFSSKTGTSTEFRDNWVVGHNDNFTVGVWAGNFNNESMRNVSGVTGAGKIFNQIVRLVYKKNYNGIKRRQKEELKSINVCKLSGLVATPLCSNTILEKFSHQRFPKHNCDIHKEVQVRGCFKKDQITKVKVEDLSQKLSYWGQYMSVIDVKDQVSLRCQREFEIVDPEKEVESYVNIKSPVSGAFYAIDPVISKKYQKLPFEIISNQSVEEVDWVVNDILVKKTKGSNSYLWPLTRGKKKLNIKIKFKNGDTESKYLSFHVL